VLDRLSFRFDETWSTVAHACRNIRVLAFEGAFLVTKDVIGRSLGKNLKYQCIECVRHSNLS